MPSSTPGWLKHPFGHGQLEAALRTLGNREFARQIARSPQYARQSSTPAHIIDHYSVAVGCEPANQMYHRYLNVQPYDRTRVGVCDSDEGERYFSGNWVRELFGGKWWIATQAPLPHTIHAFLSLLLQPVTQPPASLLSGSDATYSTRQSSRIRTVVQLARFFEGGRRKAHPYFPITVGQSLIVPPEPGSSVPSLKVTLLDSQVIEGAHCIRSTVSIASTATDDEKPTPVVFQHLFYDDWPDHGLPEDREGFLQFVRLVDQTSKDVSLASWPPHPDPDLDPFPPVMVHCSAGIGRTGAFIAISSLLRAYGCFSPSPSDSPSTEVTAPPGLPPSPLGLLPASIIDDQVIQEVDSLREQRPGMVEKDEQVRLIYEVLAVALGVDVHDGPG